MSEFTNHKETRVNQLVQLFHGILKGENPGQLVAENQKLIESTVPSDVISVVDRLVLMKIPMDDLKRGINKLLNLLYKTISEFPYYPPVKESFIGCLVENNRILDEQLQEIRPLIREINKRPESAELRNERILYPLVEEVVPEKELNSLFKESIEIGFPFYHPKFIS